MSLDNIQNYMIGIVLLVIVFTGGIYMFGAFSSYDSTLDSANEVSQFNKSIASANKITDSVNAIDESIQGVSSDSNSGVLGWLNVLVGSAFNGLKAIGSSLSFMSTATTEVGAILGIPSFVIPLLLLVVIIIIGFAIWSAIMRV